MSHFGNRFYFVGLFPFQPCFKSRTSSKRLWEGHYNLFTVTALKHIALLYSINCTLDFFDIKWLSENIIYCRHLCHWFCSIFKRYKRGWRAVATRWEAEMHARSAAHLLDPMPSQACISLFTNLSLQPVRPYSEENDLYSKHCACLCIYPSGCKHKTHSQSLQLTNTESKDSRKLRIIVKSGSLEELAGLASASST